MISLLRVLDRRGSREAGARPEDRGACACRGICFGAFGVVLLWRTSSATSAEPKLGNPFDLVPLLVFAASFAVAAAISAALTRSFGSAGVVFTSGVSGIVDVDVASLTAARLAGHAVPVSTAAEAVLLAVLLNAGMRVVAAFAIGPRGYSVVLLMATLVAAGAGLVGWLFLPP